MIPQLLINLGLVAAACLLTIVYLIKFVLKYKHQYESNPVCTITVSFCLLVVLVTAFLLPVDIFLVSFVKQSDGTFKSWADQATLTLIDRAMFATYYSLYGMIIFLVFIVIPFLHFFNEEAESNPGDRLHNAIKNTIGLTIIVALLLVGGAFLHEGKPDPNTVFDKLIQMKDVTKFQKAIITVFSLITTAGLINVSFYSASGIFSWPIGLILGTSSLNDRHKDISNTTDFLRVMINNLQQRSRIETLSPREQEQLSKAEEDLRRLELEDLALSDYSSTWSYRLRLAIRPVQILVGTLFSLLSLLLLGTLITANVDRILHSEGPKQGYIILKSSIFSPLQFIFIKLQDLILIGPLPLLIVTCFLVVATISGIRNLGLWLLLARLYHVRVGRTPPQALLFFCMTMMLAGLAFNLILYSMTPQYVTFGDQNLRVSNKNGTFEVKPCSLEDYQPDCLLTRGSILVMRMMSQIWIVGTIFYWLGWLFAIVSTISFVAYVKRGKRQAAHDVVLADDDFED